MRSAPGSSCSRFGFSHRRPRRRRNGAHDGDTILRGNVRRRAKRLPAIDSWRIVCDLVTGAPLPDARPGRHRRRPRRAAHGSRWSRPIATPSSGFGVGRRLHRGTGYAPLRCNDHPERCTGRTATRNDALPLGFLRPGPASRCADQSAGLARPALTALGGRDVLSDADLHPIRSPVTDPRGRSCLTAVNLDHAGLAQCSNGTARLDLMAFEDNDD